MLLLKLFCIITGALLSDELKKWKITLTNSKSIDSSSYCQLFYLKCWWVLLNLRIITFCYYVYIYICICIDKHLCLMPNFISGEFLRVWQYEIVSYNYTLISYISLEIYSELYIMKTFRSQLLFVYL